MPRRAISRNGRDHLDLVVGVLVDLVGLDERIDDEQADAVGSDMRDAAVDIGQPDDTAGAVGLGREQRAVGAAVHREPAADIVEGDVPVLEYGREPTLQFVAIVLIVRARPWSARGRPRR